MGLIELQTPAYTVLPTGPSVGLMDGGDPPSPTKADAASVAETSRSTTEPPCTPASAAKLSDGIHRFRLLEFARFIGTGLLASVSYLDPGNLEADIQLGVTSGMSLLWWTLITCMVFAFTFQCIAGRLGLVSGKDLAQHLGERYPKPARILLWVLMEVAIIGADIQETIGSAIALSILTSGRLPLYAGCIVVSVSAFGLLLLDRIGFRQLEAVFFCFIVTEAVAMGINFVQADVPSVDVAKGVFIPRVSKTTMPVAVAVLGALVMPYNIFFQSAIVNARPRDASCDGRKRVLLQYLRVESFLVLALAFVINLFVICVFAHGFYGTDTEVGLESAGDHLAERYGGVFKTVWAIGLLAAGQVSTIGLTFAGQLVMMGLLNLKVQAGPRMLATRLVALVPTVSLAVVFEASNTFDKVAQMLNVVQSMMLPFALIPVLHVCADKIVMGTFVSHRYLTAFGALIATVVAAVNGYLLVDFLHTEVENTPGVDAGLAFLIIVYYMVVLYFAIGPDNMGACLERCQDVWAKVRAWIRNNRRSADFESMLEVHF
ncbi:natural resistance-associated macrophage protein-domain-containing protein [Haematococcus lacustris]